MVQGPQRSGYPNRVITPHGQELGRKSDTEYTHAVVRTEPVEARRSHLQRQLDFHAEMLTKYGPENIDEHAIRRAKKATKELASLPEEGHVSDLVSMHQSSRQAEARRTRESNRGIGYSVLPVNQG